MKVEARYKFTKFKKKKKFSISLEPDPNPGNTGRGENHDPTDQRRRQLNGTTKGFVIRESQGNR